MMFKIRKLLWRVLGIDYNQALRIHDYVFLKNDKYVNIGHKTYDNGALVWRWTDAKLSIGKYCSIANNVRFIVDEGFHKGSPITSFPLVQNLYMNESTLTNGRSKDDFINTIQQREGISIGHDVWIGMGAYIMPGVTIGNGVTIAANAVVTKNIPDYTIVGGSPAKVIKNKYSDEVTQKLNQIAWWDWNEDLVKERIEDFYDSMDLFIEKYG